MSPTPKYVYDAAAPLSVSARAALADPAPEGARAGERPIGVFRFRQAYAVKITMLPNARFRAERLDRPAAAAGLRTWLERVLSILRNVLNLEGGERWTLTGKDHDEMEGCAYVLAVQEGQRRAMLQRDRALRSADIARKKRRDAARLHNVPGQILDKIGSYLPAPQTLHQACVALRETVESAKAQARGVSTLSGLNGLIRQWVQAPCAGAPGAGGPSAAARAEVAQALAERIGALPASQQREGIGALLDAIDTNLIESGIAAGALHRLAQAAKVLAGRGAPLPGSVECRFFAAIRQLPAARRVDPYLALLACHGPLQQEEVAEALMPSADWLGPHATVPASRQREVIRRLLGWADPGRLGYRNDTWSTMMSMAVELPETIAVVPTASAQAPYSLPTTAFKSMVLTELLQKPPYGVLTRSAPGADGAVPLAGTTPWDHLFALVGTWPAHHAAPVLAGLVAALNHLPEKDHAGRLAAVDQWMMDARPEPEHRLAVQIASFPFRAPQERVKAWDRLWSAWLACGPQRDPSIGARIAGLLEHHPDRANWTGALLPKLPTLPSEQRAVVLAGIPARLYRDANDPLLAEDVSHLAEMGHLEPMARWFGHHAYNKTMLEPMVAAFARLPPALQVECVLRADRQSRLPTAALEAAASAMESHQIDARTAVSLVGTLACQLAMLCKGTSTISSASSRLIGRLVALLPQVDTRHDADVMAAVAHFADILSMRARWAREPMPTLARHVADTAWQAVKDAEPHMQRATLDALFPLLVDERGLLDFSTQTFLAAVPIAKTLPPADRVDVLVQLARMEATMHGGYGRRFDVPRQALWEAIMTVPRPHVARCLAACATWFRQEPGFHEPRQAEFAKAAREFDQRWRTLPAEDRDALFPYHVERGKDGGEPTVVVRWS